MHIRFYSIKLFLIALLLSMSMANKANAQVRVDTLPVYNSTTGGYDSPASAGDLLTYTFFIRNTSAANFTGSRFYNNIPVGTSYVTGSTSLNGSFIADVNGKMPFVGSGGNINSISSGSGIIDAGSYARVQYMVKVIANAGKIRNQATCDVTSGGVSIIQSSNAIFTPLVPDAVCSIVYQATALTASGSSGYSYIRTMNTADGTGGATLYNGVIGPSYNALTGAVIRGGIMTSVAALAYDKNSNRIYFVNNSTSPAEDLCYVDLNANPIAAKKFVGYPLETNTSSGYNINRMAFTADGYGYAVTSNAQDLIRFSIDASGLPVITRLGALVNAATNGSNDILAEAGGDIFSDGAGKLYMAVSSGKLYRIDPATRVATYFGKITPVPSGAATSVAIDTAGNIYLGGAYQNVYKVDLKTRGSTTITSGVTTNVWTTGDYTSCAFPILRPDIQVNKSYRNTSGNANVAGGDTIEYTIEVVNTGNINATGVKLYDAISANSTYDPATTTMNGTTVADAAGFTMPFSVTGGRLINSPGEFAGIIKPGDANKVLIKYRIVPEPLNTICNYAKVTYSDLNGDVQTILSDDPAQPGNQATCFSSDSARTQNARIATTGNAQLNLKGTVQPNPFISELSLQLQLNTAAAVQVRLFDLYGRTVYSTSQKLATGFQSLHINVPAGLTPGIYMLEVTAGKNRLFQKKLLKQ